MPEGYSSLCRGHLKMIAGGARVVINLFLKMGQNDPKVSSGGRKKNKQTDGASNEGEQEPAAGGMHVSIKGAVSQPGLLI